MNGGRPAGGRGLRGTPAAAPRASHLRAAPRGRVVNTGVSWTCTCMRHGRVVDVSWACLGRVVGMSWACHGRVMDVSWTCRGRASRRTARAFEAFTAALSRPLASALCAAATQRTGVAGDPTAGAGAAGAAAGGGSADDPARACGVRQGGTWRGLLGVLRGPSPFPFFACTTN